MQAIWPRPAAMVAGNQDQSPQHKRSSLRPPGCPPEDRRPQPPEELLARVVVVPAIGMVAGSQDQKPCT